MKEHATGDHTTKKLKYCIKQGFILREIAGEYAIIPGDEESLISNAVMVSNDTAVFLWKAFQNPATIEAVIARGLEEYEVDEDTLRVAVCRFVEEALKYKIIEAIE